ncbi:MAG: flagellar export protein FliJ [Bacillota bacterium]
MAFEFRLQKLLDYRENQKKLAQEELARRQRELLAVQQELDRLRDEEKRLLENHRRCQEKDLNIPALIFLENYRLFLQESCRKCVEELDRGEEHVEQQRHVVLETWRSCRILSTLREKAHSEYREEEKISEQRLNDELGLKCFMRREQELGKVENHILKEGDRD